MRSSISKLLTAAVTVGLFVSGCANNEAATAGGSTTASSAAAAPSARLTDPQIAAIVVTANQIDIDNGKLAVSRTSNPDVKAFAERMMADHASVNQAAVELVTRLGVTPEETATSRGLKSDADQKRQAMSALSGAEFDRAYVDNEVAYHEAVINVLDTALIPNAQNAELKQTLEGVRPAFLAHLEHARSIQSALRGGPSAGAHH